MTEHDSLLAELQSATDTSDDCLLARAHAPLIHLDIREPFPPLVVGYTVFREAADSASTRFHVDPEGGIAIEYAIWSDWDIQHLYELEHVWVFLDATGNVARVEASSHGGKLPMQLEDGSLPLADDRVTVYSEPGKHAFAPDSTAFTTHLTEYVTRNCGVSAGEDGILVHSLFGAAAFGNPTAFDARLAKRFLQRRAFTPSFDFSRTFDLRAVPFVTWAQLQIWIPRRIIWWREQLVRRVPHLRLVCLDSGDTLVDESTEVKDGEVTLHAELIPGAADMVRQLHAEGYRLALVADGPSMTFDNVLGKQYGLWDLFAFHAISGNVGALKPDARMFRAALDALEIPPGDFRRVVMVGNNLERDIKGANAIGVISIWISWSRRRSHTPADDSEVPAYRIAAPLDLPVLLEQIELGFPESS